MNGRAAGGDERRAAVAAWLPSPVSASSASSTSRQARRRSRRSAQSTRNAARWMNIDAIEACLEPQRAKSHAGSGRHVFEIEHPVEQGVRRSSCRARCCSWRTTNARAAFMQKRVAELERERHSPAFAQSLAIRARADDGKAAQAQIAQRVRLFVQDGDGERPVEKRSRFIARCAVPHLPTRKHHPDARRPGSAARRSTASLLPRSAANPGTPARGGAVTANQGQAA